MRVQQPTPPPKKKKKEGKIINSRLSSQINAYLLYNATHAILKSTNQVHGIYGRLYVVCSDDVCPVQRAERNKIAADAVGRHKVLREPYYARHQQHARRL